MLRREQYRRSMHFMMIFALGLCTHCLKLVQCDGEMEKSGEKCR